MHFCYGEYAYNTLISQTRHYSVLCYFLFLKKKRKEKPAFHYTKSTATVAIILTSPDNTMIDGQSLFLSLGMFSAFHHNPFTSVPYVYMPCIGCQPVIPNSGLNPAANSCYSQCIVVYCSRVSPSLIHLH